MNYRSNLESSRRRGAQRRSVRSATTFLSAIGTVIGISATLTGCDSRNRSEEHQILQIEREFGKARQTGDTALLDKIMSPSYHSTNQSGSRRTKAQTLELFRTFKLASVEILEPQVTVVGDIGLVSGRQRESNCAAVYNLLFTRIYVRSRPGWRLLSSTQFIDPRLSTKHSADERTKCSTESHALARSGS
jgi:hypothetical protein